MIRLTGSIGGLDGFRDRGREGYRATLPTRAAENGFANSVDCPVCHAQRTTISARLENDATVSGTVEGLNGEGVTNASVALYSTTQVFQTKAGVDGRFNFSQVPPGTYQLQSMEAGFRRRIVPNVLVPERTSQTLEVVLEFLQCDFPASPALPDYKPSLGKNAELRGSVQTPGLHKPLRGVRLELLDPVRGDV